MIAVKLQLIIKFGQFFVGVAKLAEGGQIANLVVKIIPYQKNCEKKHEHKAQSHDVEDQIIAC